MPCGRSPRRVSAAVTIPVLFLNKFRFSSISKRAIPDDFQLTHSRLFDCLAKDFAASNSHMSKQTILMDNIDRCTILTR